MFKYAVVILLCMSQTIFTMSDSDLSHSLDDSSSDSSSISLSIEEQREVHRLVPSINSLQKTSNKFNGIAIEDFNLKKMFDGDKKAIKIFKKLDEDEALKLYCVLKSIKKSGKSVVPLMLAPQEMRDLFLKSKNTGCCLPPIFMHQDKKKIDEADENIKQYFIGNEVCLLPDEIDKKIRMFVEGSGAIWGTTLCSVCSAWGIWCCWCGMESALSANVLINWGSILGGLAGLQCVACCYAGTCLYCNTSKITL